MNPSAPIAKSTDVVENTRATSSIRRTIGSCSTSSATESSLRNSAVSNTKRPSNAPTAAKNRTVKICRMSPRRYPAPNPPFCLLQIAGGAFSRRQFGGFGGFGGGAVGGGGDLRR